MPLNASSALSWILQTRPVRRLLDHAIPRQPSLNDLVRNGLQVGDDCFIDRSVTFDMDYIHLLAIGDKVTITTNTIILCHDASMKRSTGFVRIAPVTIEDNVFIGAGTVILPGTRIGKGSVVGAGSVVATDIPEEVIAVGNPAKPVLTKKDFVAKHSSKIEHGTVPRNKIAVPHCTDSDEARAMVGKESYTE